MRVLTSLAAAVETLLGVDRAEDLDAALAAIAAVLDLDSYALLIRPDGAWTPGTGYWSGSLDWISGALCSRGLDLLRRACDSDRLGFAWADIARLVPLTPADRRFLAALRAHGLRSGFTVPVYGPGALYGSCSFAGRTARTIAPAERILAQSLAPFAWEAGRRLAHPPAAAPPRLTDRQRECLLWAARGKTDWAIARILAIGEDTVESHLREARVRYGVEKRTSLIVRALFDRTLSFEEVLGLGYSGFPG